MTAIAVRPDNAGRLTQVVDSATSTTEAYTWNADGTLASYPGATYTRLLDYDEEKRLIRIRKDYGGGNVAIAYEYGYGFDGARRWRQDLDNQVWTRYPCAVASCAGDLVEQESDLNGNTWTTTALYLRGNGLVRRNAEFHHADLGGNVGVVTNASGTVLSSNLYDTFGVLRFAQGSAATQWRPAAGQVDAEGLVVLGDRYTMPSRGVQVARALTNMQPGFTTRPCTGERLEECTTLCALVGMQVLHCTESVGPVPIPRPGRPPRDPEIKLGECACGGSLFPDPVPVPLPPRPTPSTRTIPPAGSATLSRTSQF